MACFTRWVVDNGWIDSGEVKILTTAGVVRGKRLDDGYVRACIPLPEDIRRNFTVQFDDTLWQCDYAVTGVPHLVTYVDDVDALDLPAIGPTLRYHPQFAPRGVNVNFVQVLGEGHIALRTWEFGVEGETLACGTGSSAAAILAALRFDWPQAYRSNDKPVLVKARSGDTLRIYFDMTADGRIADLCLETIVRFVYLGRLHGDLAAAALNPGPT